MICKQYNSIFVHIPRTAGQSIENFFLNLVGLDWKNRSVLLLKQNNNPLHGPERLAHLTASEYVSYGYVNESEFNFNYKFSFVRNPWERIVSEYQFRNSSKYFSFEEFVSLRLPKPGLSDSYRHIMPQYEFLHDSNGNLLVDFIGRFENLQSDFNVICNTLGICNSKLPHVNSSNFANDLKKTIKMCMYGQEKHTSYAEYYNNKTRKIVSDIYEKDISCFDYKF